MSSSIPPGTRARPSRLAATILATVALVAGCSSNDQTGTQLTATTVAVVSGNQQTGTVGAALATPFVVRVTDQNGAAMSGVLVNFSASGGATLKTPTATTNASGLATDSVMAIGTTAGADTVRATVSGVTNAAIFTFAATAGAAANVTIVSGNNQSATAGAALAAPLVVKVTDQFGNAVANATIVWTTSAGVLAGSTQTVSNASGTATAALQLPAVAGTVTVTATLQGTAKAATFTETAM